MKRRVRHKNIMKSMDTINLFDAIGYFKDMCLKNKLAKAHKILSLCLFRINSLEEVLENFRKQSAFFAVDDTNDGVTERRSGGFLRRELSRSS